MGISGAWKIIKKKLGIIIISFQKTKG